MEIVNHMQTITRNKTLISEADKPVTCYSNKVLPQKTISVQPVNQQQYFNDRLRQNREAFQKVRVKMYSEGFETKDCSDISNYSIGKEIGKGAYAVVKEGLHKPTGKLVAIKIYERTKLQDQHKKRQAMKEIKTLAHLNHLNIVKLYEAIEGPNHIYLIMEFVQGESLHSFLKSQNSRRLSEE